MAFLTTSANYGYEIAELFGTSKSLINDAKNKGVGIFVPAPGEFLVHLGTGANKTTIAKFSVPAKVVTMAKQNTLGPASKNGIEDKFSSALKQAIAQAKPVAVEFTNDAFGSPAQTHVQPKPFTAPPPHPGGIVALKDATIMGQVVGGTDQGSKYLFFAHHDSGLKFALRMKGTKLSLRCEGSESALNSHAHKLNEALGFDKNPGYCSVHLNCPKPYQPLKALGCLVAVMGVSSFKNLGSLEGTLTASKANAA